MVSAAQAASLQAAMGSPAVVCLQEHHLGDKGILADLSMVLSCQGPSGLLKPADYPQLVAGLSTSQVCSPQTWVSPTSSRLVCKLTTSLPL